MNDFARITSVTALGIFPGTPEQPTGQALFSQAQPNLCGSYPCVVSQFQQPGLGGIYQDTRNPKRGRTPFFLSLLLFQGCLHPGKGHTSFQK